MNPPHPFDRLTPDLVQDAMAQVGLFGDGRLSALPSYENRVYLAPLERPAPDHPDVNAVVLKFYRPERWGEAQILEEHAFAQELADAEVPMVAPLRWSGQSLHHIDGFRFSVSPRRGGRTPELDDLEVLEWTGRLLARLHDVGARQPFASRPALNLDSFGVQPLQWLLSHDAVTPGQRAEWERTCRDMLDRVAQHPALCGDAGSPQGGIRQLRTHGDCHPGNILWTPGDGADAGPHFVDLDDARTAPAVQDLWMLAQGERAQRTLQLSVLIEGYEQVRPFDRRELALIEPLRSLRLLHYSCWLAQRQSDPAFQQAFAWFGSDDYWRDQIVTLREQCEAMDQPPLWV
ncbi:stress response serine/threonine protein kinase YihE [Comamonas serinivorans]|uniref:Stress response kinase A n=1 Tax=Comamonas serinivorans TaxID=1082851 RepID=A0A1Y0ES74_9BURK|nr:serine/threonine protein kinase [Comamonas serinivorans]ARU06426.1 stress response serine/threonine protein kinase YihE [Comamonas serinivorans]